MPADGKQLSAEYEFLRRYRANFETRWDAMAPFTAPSRLGIVTQQRPGQDQMAGVLDSTSLGAADMFAKFICGQTMNPGQRWGEVHQKKFGLEDRDDVDDWADETTDRMLQALGASNFYAEGPQTAVDWGGFGTGFLLLEERPEYADDYQRRRGGFRGVRTQCIKTGRFTIARNAEGKADKFFTEDQMSARAIAARWGEERLPEKIKNALRAAPGQNQPETMFTVVHGVYPRQRSERKGKGYLSFPIASCWFEKESKEIIFEGGYKWFPAAIPACEQTPGEIYGRGPGDRAFPDTKTLNKLKEFELKDLALKVAPPIIVSHEARVGDIRLRPSTPTVVKTGPNRGWKDVIGPWETGSRPEVAQLKEEELRRAINQLYYVDLLRDLLKIEKSSMTAYEYGEKLRLLYQLIGSIYGGWQYDFLTPVWDATFSLMWDAGALPPPPDVLFDEGRQIGVEFTSPLALAQKSADIDGIRMTYADIGLIALNDPEKANNLRDNFEDDDAMRTIAERRGMPARLIRSKDLRDKIRQARNDERAKQAQLANVESVTQAGKNIAPLIEALKPQGSA